MFRYPAVGRLSAVLVFAVLAASCGGSSATTPSTSTVASVALTPASDSIVPSQTAQLTASAKDAGGAAVSDATISWSVTPSTVATVSNSGMVTGVARGSAAVTAQSNGKSATAVITVTDGGIVSTSGATITGVGGMATLIIPANALTAPLPVSIQPSIMPLISPTLIPATAVDFGPTGTQFAQPVTVKLHYTAAQVPVGTNASQLQLYLRTGNSWTVVPGSTVDTVAQVVTGTTTHFSSYAACENICVPDATYLNISTANVKPPVIAPGGTGTGTGYSIQAGGYTGAVGFDITGLPAGILATASVTDLTQDGFGGEFGHFSVRVTVASSVTGGTYSVTVKGSGGGLSSQDMMGFFVVVPSYTMTPTPASLSIIAGSSATSAMALARTQFTGSVALTAENLPAGVTASFAPASTTDNASVLTLNTGSSAVPGNYTVTVRGKAAGVSDVLTTVFLTINPASGFTIAGTPAFVNVPQLGNGSTGVQATRLTGFSGAISYAATGLPTGLTAAITTTSVTDSLKVTFTAAAGLAAGTYPVTITGTSGAKSSQVIISVTVAAPGTVTVHLDYSSCDPSVKPIWVAYQDGNSAFTQVIGAGDVYTFNLISGKGAAAVVVPGLTSATTTVPYTTGVFFGAASELSNMAICVMLQPPDGKTWNITVLNALSSGLYVSTPGGTTESSAAGIVGGVPSGLQDIIGLNYNPVTPAQNPRGFILRGINLPNGGTVSTPIDFTGSSSFVPVLGTLTVGNVNADQLDAQLLYLSQPSSCSNAALFSGSNPAAASSTVFGFPASVQLATDLHLARAGAGTRIVDHWFHTFASQSISLGGVLPTPSIAALSGLYKRPQVTLSVPSDYSYLIYSWSGPGNGLSMLGSAAYFGGQTMTLAMPDLTTVAGYNAASWAPAVANGSYFMSAESALTESCSDGATFRRVFLQGTN